MNKTDPFEKVADLVPWLEGRGAEEWRGWLREALEENSRLRQKLGRQAQRELGQALDLRVLKRQIVQATAPPPGGFVDWRGATTYCRAMESACVDPLEELLLEGPAAEVVELAEWVLTLTERASEHVQDAGEVGMMWETVCGPCIWKLAGGRSRTGWPWQGGFLCRLFRMTITPFRTWSIPIGIILERRDGRSSEGSRKSDWRGCPCRHRNHRRLTGKSREGGRWRKANSVNSSFGISGN